MTLRSIAAAAALMTALPGMGGLAAAADLDEIIYARQAPKTTPVEIGSGWYIRGDLGYAIETEGKARDYRTFDPVTGYDTGRWDSAHFDSEWSGAIGIGYQIHDLFRTDLTFEYSAGDFEGRTSAAAGCTGGAGFCRSDDRSEYETYGFMANAYVDLGTVAGLTPYVGGGVGIMNVNYESLESSYFDCTAGCAAAFATEREGHESWRFSYALMAGIAYDITRNLKLDLGYRYQRIDDGDMFGFSDAQRAVGASGVQGSDDGFDKHEIRAGLRYEIW